MHRGKIRRRHRQKTAMYKPRTEALEEVDPSDNLTLDFQLENGVKASFCCLSHLVCGSLLW